MSIRLPIRSQLRAVIRDDPLCRPAATSDVRDYLCGRAAADWRAHLLVLVTGFVVSAASNNCATVCQQFDGFPSAELPNPDYRDGSVQVNDGDAILSRDR